MNESKQYDIPKKAVIEAYKRVKANKVLFCKLIGTLFIKLNEPVLMG